MSLFGKIFLQKEKPLRHQPSRKQLRMAKRAYNAAKIDNLTLGWGTTITSADAEIRYSLKQLRARSRNLSQNDPYFKHFLRLCYTNVIGNNGIRLQARSIKQVKTDGSVIFDDRANSIIEESWREWGKKKFCTVTGRYSWLDVQKLFIETVARDGEVLIRKIKGYQNPFGFTLQLIEADHLDEEYNQNLSNGNYIRMGIEFNSLAHPLAYHILNIHPGDSTFATQQGKEYIRIPAEEIIHAYVPERISQSRGVPWGASSMTRSNMLNGYQEAELVAARTGASKMGFFISPDGEGYNGQDHDGDSDNYDLITEADPGTFEQLPAGVDFKEFSPDHPSTAFEPFIRSILRGMASGLGISYNTMANDLQGVNFSSLRQGNLIERDLWKMVQQWVIENLHEEIFSDWLLMSITTEKLGLPLSKFEKFNRPQWRPRGWMWVDPTKEITANSQAIDTGLKSAQDCASEQGMDIEDIYQQLASEQNLREKYGIVLGNKAMPMTKGIQEQVDEEQPEG